ncbi:DNA-methyltransferase [Halocatena halophila]|uniref:DNA-methyltransferase n=1 Tax=Halocatena halophila TaxID=2814576 RepID=UPI002ED3DD61
MKTTHSVRIEDVRELTLPADSVELVVTSPPYPMIEMWDELFCSLDEEIEGALDGSDGETAFELMHQALDPVWDTLSRVLVDGGIACINVGDATRNVGEGFRVFQNHVRISDALTDRGFSPLPDVLWRKPSNSGAKFMGSGMLPPNAYVTLEHEYILVFRNGSSRRSFESNADDRYESAFFWEERNRWFSDTWSDINGTEQPLELPGEDDDVRDRSGAFPFSIPYRLINMYSVYGDTVFDPFWGTGTTSLAAMVAARNSIGCEIEPAMAELFEQRLESVVGFAEDVLSGRLDAHESFVDRRTTDEGPLSYDASNYDLPVMTKQERDIQLYAIDGISATEKPEGTQYTVEHDPFYRDTTGEPSLTETLERAKIDSLSDI